VFIYVCVYTHTGRIDYQDRAIRLNESRMEFVWRASAALGPSAQVFTGAFQVCVCVCVKLCV